MTSLLRNSISREQNNVLELNACCLSASGSLWLVPLSSFVIHSIALDSKAELVFHICNIYVYKILGTIHKREMLVFHFDVVSFVFDEKFPTKENFGCFDFVAALLFIFDVIEIVTQNVEKWIDVIKRVIDVHNADHDKHQHIHAICAHQT